MPSFFPITNFMSIFTEGQNDRLWPLQGDEGQEDGKYGTHGTNLFLAVIDWPSYNLLPSS